MYNIANSIKKNRIIVLKDCQFKFIDSKISAVL